MSTLSTYIAENPNKFLGTYFKGSLYNCQLECDSLSKELMSVLTSNHDLGKTPQKVYTYVNPVSNRPVLKVGSSQSAFRLVAL